MSFVSNLQRLFLFLYLLIAGLHLAGIYLALDTLLWFTKPLLMPVLLAYWWQASQGHNHRFRRAMGWGLCFAWLGDVLLLLGGHTTGTKAEWLFLAGLLAFLVTHLCYSSGFWLEAGRSWRSLRANSLLAVPVIGILLAFYLLFWGKIGPLTLPVYLYAAVISTMVLLAINLRAARPLRNYRWIVAGATLFLLSDLMIALDRFQEAWKLPGPGLLIMSTYCLGQGLIIYGNRRSRSR